MIESFIEQGSTYAADIDFLINLIGWLVGVWFFLADNLQLWQIDHIGSDFNARTFFFAFLITFISAHGLQAASSDEPPHTLKLSVSQTQRSFSSLAISVLRQYWHEAVPLGLCFPSGHCEQIPWASGACPPGHDTAAGAAAVLS